jgi:hypothetical protein
LADQLILFQQANPQSLSRAGSDKIGPTARFEERQKIQRQRLQEGSAGKNIEIKTVTLVKIIRTLPQTAHAEI